MSSNDHFAVYATNKKRFSVVGLANAFSVFQYNVLSSTPWTLLLMVQDLGWSDCVAALNKSCWWRLNWRVVWGWLRPSRSYSCQKPAKWTLICLQHVSGNQSDKLRFLICPLGVTAQGLCRISSVNDIFSFSRDFFPHAKTSWHLVYALTLINICLHSPPM